MNRRYGYRMLVLPHEWGQLGLHFHIERFRRAVERWCRGVHPSPPPDAPVECVGWRLNSEGARDDRGELPPRIECEPDDPRAVEIEMRIGWRA